jgi:hypothetical protein
MGWSHRDSYEVGLVLEVLETLMKHSMSVNLDTGDVSYGIRFTRERQIKGSVFESATKKRFDFSVLVDDGKAVREFLIEVHGEQHYSINSLLDGIRESDRLKKEWARIREIPLLVLPSHEVLKLWSESKLPDRITKFLTTK